MRLADLRAPTRILVSALIIVLSLMGLMGLWLRKNSETRNFEKGLTLWKKARELERTLTGLDPSQKGDGIERFRRLLIEEKAIIGGDDGVELVSRLEDWLRLYESRKSGDVLTIETLNSQGISLCRDLENRGVRRMEADAVGRGFSGVWVIMEAGVGWTLGCLAGLLAGGLIIRRIVRSSVGDDDLRKPGDFAVSHDTQKLSENTEQMAAEIERISVKFSQRIREVLLIEQVAADDRAAGAAHEMRNPMTAIKMLLQVKREEADSVGLRDDDLDAIEREIRRIEQCLRSFLLIVRPSELAHRPLDLVVAVDATLLILRGIALKQGAALKFEKKNAPVMIDGDGEKIHQIIVNLVMNSLDAIPDGGTIEIVLRAADGSSAELTVSDNGPGIDPEILPQLFKPFVSGKETGLGLGLVISRQIAESHGGTITATNRPHGGACFVLRLPTRARAESSSNRSVQ